MSGDASTAVYNYDEKILQPNFIRDIGEDESENDILKAFTAPDQLKDDDCYELTNKLNTKQRQYLMHVNEFKIDNIPIYHFLSGGAGVGKSMLIRAIYQSVIRLYRQNPGPVEESEVFICAYTGKAAHGVGGTTIHSLFGFR